MLTAIETWQKIDIDSLNREWNAKVQRIAKVVETVPGVIDEDLRSGRGEQLSDIEGDVGRTDALVSRSLNAINNCVPVSRVLKC